MTQVNFGPAGTHLSRYLILFFFNDTATTEIYTLSLHDALPIAGFQVHVEDSACYDHEAFRPWRLFALAFKALRSLRSDYPLWRDFPHEDEHARPAIDRINRGEPPRRRGGDPAPPPPGPDPPAD